MLQEDLRHYLYNNFNGQSSRAIVICLSTRIHYTCLFLLHICSTQTLPPYRYLYTLPNRYLYSPYILPPVGTYILHNLIHILYGHTSHSAVISHVWTILHLTHWLWDVHCTVYTSLMVASAHHSELAVHGSYPNDNLPYLLHCKEHAHAGRRRKGIIHLKLMGTKMLFLLLKEFTCYRWKGDPPPLLPPPHIRQLAHCANPNSG